MTGSVTLYDRASGDERNPEAEDLLAEARRKLGERQHADAVPVLQRMLELPGEPMATADGLVFVPPRDLATRMLAAMPPEGLRLYRLLTDRQAAQLPGDVASSVDAGALGQVVRRYFVGSVGDDAAYRLACLRLDAGNYAGARRLLRTVLADHSDPSVPRPQILSRLALACVRYGDLQGAREAMRQLAPHEIAAALGRP